MPRLSRIRVHPIKSLDPIELERVGISPSGGLEGDRSYAIVDADGEYVNGKRTASVHRLDVDVDPGDDVVSIGVRGAERREEFHLDRERDELADWLSSYFGFDVHVEAASGGELTDSRVYGDNVAGATVVSTATLERVASWFPDPELDIDDVRRRFRANLEIEGVDAFWEDRLVGDDDARLRVGDVTFRGVSPVPRCVVPTRDPATGEPTDGFRERFIEMRERTFPPWGDPDAFDHYYALTVLTHPAGVGRGETIAVGDEIEIGQAVRPGRNAGD